MSYSPYICRLTLAKKSPRYSSTSISSSRIINYEGQLTSTIAGALFIRIIGLVSPVSQRRTIASTAPAKQQSLSPAYLYQHEALPHKGTLMTWPTAGSIPSSSEINTTRIELASIARTISRFEPVELFVHNDDVSSARELLSNVASVHIHPTPAVCSLWARDTGPLWVRNRNDSGVSGVILHFNNWGAKLPRNADSYTAEAVLSTLDVKAVSGSFVTEGGVLEFDGDRTLLATESYLVNENRNPRLTKEDLELEFARMFGVEKTIWLKGSKGTDITDSHINALARFVTPGLVVLSKPRESAEKYEEGIYQDAKSVLMEATDGKDKKLSVVEIQEPEDHEVQEGDVQDFGSELCVSYLNYYVCNDAVVMAQFGDERADAKAKETIGMLYRGRVVEQIPLRN